MAMQNSNIIYLILTCLLFMPVVARADPVDELVRAELTRSKSPGAVIVVVEGGRVMRVQGYGQANIEHAIPVHADTLFKTGATGMQFTAVAIMMLVEDGKLELDAPVSRYLPGTPAKWSKVTIRQLLNHTSGLPATPNGDFRADYSSSQLLAIIAAQDMNFPAGMRYRFSYAGYIVLGMVIEQISGEHWSKFMAHRLFAPLGMQTARGIDEQAIVPNRAAGYEVRDGALRNAEWVSPTANSTADGSLYLSGLDYAAWAQAMSRRSLLSPQSWAELSQQARIVDGSVCDAVPGWLTNMAGPEPVQWQAGSWQGFQTYSLRYPAKDLTIAVFANGENADVPSLARGIAALTDPALVGLPASVLAQADPATTARARTLIEDIAAGRAHQSAFTDFARLDFTELTDLYAGMLGKLGALRQFELFERKGNCAETVYRYRARFDQTMVEVHLGLSDKNKVTSLEIAPLTDWNSPL